MTSIPCRSLWSKTSKNTPSDPSVTHSLGSQDPIKGWEAAKHRQASPSLEAQTLIGGSSSSCETAGNQCTPNVTVGPTRCSQTTSKYFRKYWQAEPLVESLPERPKHQRRLQDPETSLWHQIELARICWDVLNGFKWMKDVERCWKSQHPKPAVYSTILHHLDVVRREAKWFKGDESGWGSTSTPHWTPLCYSENAFEWLKHVLNGCKTLQNNAKHLLFPDLAGKEERGFSQGTSTTAELDCSFIQHEELKLLWLRQ